MRNAYIAFAEKPKGKYSNPARGVSSQRFSCVHVLRGCPGLCVMHPQLICCSGYCPMTTQVTSCSRYCMLPAYVNRFSGKVTCCSRYCLMNHNVTLLKILFDDTSRDMSLKILFGDFSHHHSRHCLMTPHVTCHSRYCLVTSHITCHSGYCLILPHVIHCPCVFSIDPQSSITALLSTANTHTHTHTHTYSLTHNSGGGL